MGIIGDQFIKKKVGISNIFYVFIITTTHELHVKYATGVMNDVE